MAEGSEMRWSGMPGFGELANAILLTLVVLPPAWALAQVRLDPTLPFGLLVLVAVVGLFVGILFAYSGLPGEVAHPIALGGGTVGVFYALAGILPSVPTDATLVERLGEIVYEIVAWFRVVVTGGQATNNLLFLLLLAIVAWVIAYFGAWAVFREQSAWWPVTVSATALTLILATFPSLYAYMIVQLVAAMLLVGRVNFQSRELRWRAAGLRQSGEVAGRVFRASLALALALVFLSWVAPEALASRAISQGLGHADRPWETAQQQFNRLFGGLQAQNEASLSGFSRSITLHGSFHLADSDVLRIVSPRPEYWRVMVFDRYDGHGWVSSDPVDQRTLPAGSDRLRPTDQARADLTQQVTVLASRGSYLVGASQPSIFDIAVHAQAYPEPPSTEVDLVSAQSTQPISSNTHYSVISKISQASENDLRAANRSYPTEVRQRYLPLPGIPTRDRELALQLTSPEGNPYDKAVAVESYLRTLPYSLDLPAPPADQDGVDYFLFDARTGYCDYFASAMAVLLRSAGIPARVVSGYATGERQDDGSFLVKDSDSHTWTEVYFPSYGWIPFEPSGSWPRFARGSGDAAAATPSPVPASQPPAGSDQSQTQMTPTPTPSPTPVSDSSSPATSALTHQPLDLRPLLPFLYLIAFLAAVVLLLWYLWEKDLRGLPPTVVAYVKMTRLASLLGFGLRTAETPNEYGEALAGAVPEAQTSASRIAADYAVYRFGHQNPDSPERPLRLWRFIRNALLRRIGRLRRE
jgi:transglutaminase-like putative cysteine protease